MNNAEILHKSIEKAVNNGWTCFNGKFLKVYKNSDCDANMSVFVNERKRNKQGLQQTLFSPEEVIFSHSFAKAFFGGDWKNNLQEMVLEKDTIKYLEKFL